MTAGAEWEIRTTVTQSPRGGALSLMADFFNSPVEQGPA